jgi:glycerol-3-phosphate dehydrogenase
VSREARLERLRTESFDLLVVGAGITGAGVARDGALRGLNVAVIDASDYASGTSSRSSRLVHGGLRYLEGFEFGLVFESLRERARQRKLQPHLVWPIEFLVPVYEEDQHGLLKMDFGLWIYDMLSVGRTARWHSRLSAKRFLERVPGLRAEGLRGGISYHDCRTDDARLTLANVMDAARHEAAALNYVSLVAPHFEDERVVGATVEDVLTGEQISMETAHIVYACGPWTDRLPEAPGGGNLMRPTKGVHIVLPRSRVPVDAAVVVSAPSDGRVIFVVPEGDTVYVGTTDTDYSGDPSEVRATADDVAYILDALHCYFPDAKIEAKDVCGTWAGVRPLIASDADSAYATSREHEVYEDPRGLTTVAGGKLTTYRSMAEEVVDAVIGGGRTRRARGWKKCATQSLPLDPTLGPEPTRDSEDGVLDHHLWRVHGGGSAWVRARIEAFPEETAALHSALPYRMAEVSRAVLAEHAVRVDDILMRRLHLFTEAPDQGLGCVDRVAEHAAGLLGRGEEWAVAEAKRYREMVDRSRLGTRALEQSGGGDTLGAS